MADPLSIAASALTILSASTTCAQALQSAIWNWRNAPLEIAQLNNEVVELQGLLDSLYANLKTEPRVQPSLTATTERKLNAMKVALAELEELVEKSFNGASRGRLKYNWLREKQRVRKIQKILLKARCELQEILSVGTFILVQDISSRFEPPTVTSDKVTRTDSGPPTVQDISIAEIKSRFPNRHSADALHIPERSSLQNDQSFLPNQDSPNSIQFVQGRRNTCNKVSCDCSCHFSTSYQTPPFVKASLGALFVGYSGTPVVVSGCSNKNCKASTNRAFEVVYCFPQWFMARVVHFLAATTSVGNPVFGLSFARVVPWGREDNILRPALTGHIDGLKVLLNKKLASLSDVDPDYGQTALHYAVLHKRIDTCKFLLAAGANPHSIDQRNISPHQIAWDHILTWEGDPKEADDLRQIFPENDICETWELTHLHKIVLSIHPLKLTTELQNAQHQSQVNARDLKGQTPLHWAARTGKHEEVQQLLDADAETDVKDQAGNTPLISGASSGSLRTLELLILAGAKVGQKNHRGHQALHNASKHRKGLTLVKLLLQAGASIHCRNSDGITPFIGAAIANRAEIGLYLLEKGANIEQAGKQGNTALLETVYHDSHDFLRLLLHKNANHLHTNKAGTSIMHAAALEGDVETIRILTDAEMRGIDWGAKDANGKTALEIAAARPSPPQGFQEAFRQFVTKHRDT